MLRFFSKVGNVLSSFNLLNSVKSSARMHSIVEELKVISTDLIYKLKDIPNNETEQEDQLQKYFKDLRDLGATEIKIQDLPNGLEWINVNKPLSFNKELKGKLVLLDFFTYCCINCMHVLPQLRILEQQFPISDGFVVIGVHSAKFTNEKQLQNIENAVQRYEIHHPVVNDKNNQIWNMVGCNCWPSFYIISPTGNPILISMGEGHYESLRAFIKFSLEYYKNDLNKESLDDVIKLEQISGGVLSYPGKVAVDPTGATIAISDTNNHRIVIANSSTGHEIYSIGVKKQAGFADGSFSEAKFNSPQGLCFSTNKLLYVADTENHAIRTIDLKEKKVSTLIGNGKQGNDYRGGSEGNSQEISSPWDLDLHGDLLYIAMAGTHQLWGYVLRDTMLWGRPLEQGKCYNIVGSGREENKNNSRPLLAGLAQPSGISIDDKNVLYFADSESSAVRRVQLCGNGVVEGIVGGHLNPSNLFAYGDVDGTGNEAKLQHPLDVVYCPYDKMVYVADSYNHKIKKIDCSAKRLMTVAAANKVKFNEPGGISCFKNLIYIADTNNHCIRVLDVSKNEVTTLEITEKLSENDEPLEQSDISVLTVNPNGKVNLEIKLVLPQNVTLTPNAPSSWTVLVNDEKMVIHGGTFSLNPSWTIPVKMNENPSILAKCRLFLCIGNACYVKEASFRMKLDFDTKAPEMVNHSIIYVDRI